MSASARFGPYSVYECLGAGGMATVHRASIELETGGVYEVALKRLLPQFADDQRFVADLIREGKLAAQLDHPNIVRILELGRVGRTYFIAMDLVRGWSLMALLQKSVVKGARPPLGVVLALVHEALDALDHAHAAQIVHRDLTPSNLIVSTEGHLKIIDFGVAKALVGTLQTQSGLAKGKLGYMAVEAITGKHVDTRADIFSAGVVLWELIALRRLFPGDSDVDVMNAVATGVIEPPGRHNPECPGQLDAIVLRALRRSREERWESAAEMADAIATLRKHYPASERDILQWVEDVFSDTDYQLQSIAFEESSGHNLAYADSVLDHATCDDIPTDEHTQTIDEELNGPTERPDPAQFAFLELSTYLDRKR